MLVDFGKPFADPDQYCQHEKSVPKISEEFRTVIGQYLGRVFTYEVYVCSEDGLPSEFYMNWCTICNRFFYAPPHIMYCLECGNKKSERARK